MSSKLPLLAFGGLVIAGCTFQPTYVPLPPTHPASPYAMESPIAPRSSTLTIRTDSLVPPQPDWQIPGMRTDEFQGKAAGQMPTKMQHGMDDGAMQHGDHRTHVPGMVKMEAPPDVVDYAPAQIQHTRSAPAPKEHEPEVHLEHTDPARREAQPQQAPIAPAKMEHDQHGDRSAPASASPQQKRVKSKAEDAHSEHPARVQSTPAPTSPPARPPASTPAGEHQHH